jgi:glycosyltransferase involved in cell wall biosynthesis
MRGVTGAGTGEPMTRQPLVTIGCAVYNGEKTLARALRSVVGQDYPHVEILIADDCSTDGSLAICAEFAARDPRVRIIRNGSNIGLIQNFNLLFREAKGEYFMWADQDDVRAATFVSKTLAALEADPEAVLCHSHTGGFIGDPSDVKVIGTLNGVSGVRPVITRYRRFLRNFSDTTIYGLIRSDALRRTQLWPAELGAANALLFELLLLGPFVQVPEVLYLYSGRGLRNRPGPEDDYRMTKRRKMPWYYFPFLVVALNQTKGIGRARLGLLHKAALLSVLWGHVGTVFMTKLVYRVLYRIAAGRVPDWFTNMCDAIVESKAHVVFLGDSARDEDLFPKAWALKGRRS